MEGTKNHAFEGDNGTVSWHIFCLLLQRSKIYLHLNYIVQSQMATDNNRGDKAELTKLSISEVN